MVLIAIYDEDYLGFSYAGSGPGGDHTMRWMPWWWESKAGG